MKFSERWLREWSNPAITSAQLTEQLTMAGLEVESVSPMAPGLTNVIVAEILKVERHPNADRLNVCKVSTGKGEALSIVCGASNVRAGLKTALATVGAALPGNIIIEQAKMRGVDSQGMLCSSSELGLGEINNGIMELPDDAPVGTELTHYLKLPDNIIEIKLTPNRGDCLSLVGLARDINAINQLPMHEPEHRSIAAASTFTFPINIIASTGCPRYVGRVIRGIDSQAVTPLWLQERLRRSDIRCIHPVVDVTNYIMLELGQPLHSFDLANLQTEIQVRYANPKETIQLLNGQRLELDENVLIIADKERAVALAGIMGAADSGITSTTTDIFLESAFFDPLTISKSARHFQIFTDSSQRYERGVDYNLQNHAIERATELLLSIVGGEAGPIVEKTGKLPVADAITLRRKRINHILGVNLEEYVVENILQRLGMQINSHTEGWSVIPPSHRFDITLEIDLIEELARIYGYENIPKQSFFTPIDIQPKLETQTTVSRLSQLLVDKGYREAITYSFIEARLQTLFDPHSAPLVLVNPISADMSVMRTSLLPGLVQSVIFNINRQQSRVRLFEKGLCFKQSANGLSQQPYLAGAITGSVYPEQWSERAKAVDFFDIKGDVESILLLTRDRHFTFAKAEHPALHPGQSSIIMYNNKQIGYLGRLHPKVQQHLDVTAPIYVFELMLDEIKATILPHYKSPSKYPSLRRDLAFIVNQGVAVHDIQTKIALIAGGLLQHVQLFDIYQGEGIAAGKKSVALGLTFQLSSRTLIDSEIDEVIHRVISMLEGDFNASLRI
jgi:phenylalanyl-tRNA synthetase beta chain